MAASSFSENRTDRTSIAEAVSGLHRQPILRHRIESQPRPLDRITVCCPQQVLSTGTSVRRSLLHVAERPRTQRIRKADSKSSLAHTEEAARRAPYLPTTMHIIKVQRGGIAEFYCRPSALGISPEFSMVLTALRPRSADIILAETGRKILF